MANGLDSVEKSNETKLGTKRKNDATPSQDVIPAKKKSLETPKRGASPKKKVPGTNISHKIFHLHIRASLGI